MAPHEKQQFPSPMYLATEHMELAAITSTSSSVVGNSYDYNSANKNDSMCSNDNLKARQRPPLVLDCVDIKNHALRTAISAAQLLLGAGAVVTRQKQQEF
jgi:hypothetical protein